MLTAGALHVGPKKQTKHDGGKILVNTLIENDCLIDLRCSPTYTDSLWEKKSIVVYSFT